MESTMHHQNLENKVKEKWFQLVQVSFIKHKLITYFLLILKFPHILKQELYSNPRSVCTHVHVKGSPSSSLSCSSLSLPHHTRCRHHGNPNQYHCQNHFPHGTNNIISMLFLILMGNSHYICDALCPASVTQIIGDVAEQKNSWASMSSSEPVRNSLRGRYVSVNQH